MNQLQSKMILQGSGSWLPLVWRMFTPSWSYEVFTIPRATQKDTKRRVNDNDLYPPVYQPWLALKCLSDDFPSYKGYKLLSTSMATSGISQPWWHRGEKCSPQRRAPRMRCEWSQWKWPGRSPRRCQWMSGLGIPWWIPWEHAVSGVKISGKQTWKVKISSPHKSSRERYCKLPFSLASFRL
jgi:hypothetical protein